ncbi:hypothetical protein, partial [Acinetobacter baumannii]|uniref:hypothetical protein n=1 Tax=Acinetobacter baumannii TaxID=470 RepID=UPI000A84ECCA
ITIDLTCFLSVSRRSLDTPTRGYMMIIWQFIKDNFGLFLYFILAVVVCIQFALKTLREIKYEQDDDQYIP